MRFLQRISQFVFGPRRRPLVGLHRQVLEAARDALQPEHRDAFGAQLSSGPATRFRAFRTWAHLWIGETEAPAIILSHRSVLLARVEFRFANRPAVADVWALDGRVRLVEYKGSLGRRPEASATHLAATALYRPEQDPDRPHPPPPTVPPPAWLEPHLPGGARVFARVASGPEIAPFTGADIPEDLRALWKDTGGLTFAALTLLGPGEVGVRSLAGEDRLVIGRMDADEIGIALQAPGRLQLFWHDDDPEDLGPSLLGALPTLLRLAAR